MSIPTRSSLVGFIVSAPELNYTQSNDERCRMRVGVEQRRREGDGTFTTLDPAFHDLVAFGRTARETWGRFRPGDRFIATGYVHSYEVDAAGGSRIKEEFVARRIGHDATRTRYDVTRPRVSASGSAPTSSPPACTPARAAQSAPAATAGC